MYLVLGYLAKVVCRADLGQRQIPQLRRHRLLNSPTMSNSAHLSRPLAHQHQQQQPPKSFSAPPNAFSLKPSPLSSRTASPAGASAIQNSKKAPALDSFSNLVSFGRDKQQSNLSLLEQQSKLEEQRRKDADESRRKMDALFGGGSAGGGGVNNGFWDQLGSAKSSPAPSTSSNIGGGGVYDNDDDDDILAAFNSAAPVDNRSRFPPPASSKPPSTSPEATASSGFGLLGNDFLSAPPPPRSSDPFDPFDAANLTPRAHSPFPTTPAQNDDDFDILGDLAKPVSELPPRPVPQPTPKTTYREDTPLPPSPDPRDHAIAEIMDMGFSAEQAMQALAETDSGLDVQGAIGWLLDQAHQKSKPATPAASERQERSESSRRRRPQERASEDQDDEDRVPAWARPSSRTEGGDNAPAWARPSTRPGGGDKDLGAMAAEVGGNLFKSANSLWSTGRKKMEKAVAELKADLADGGGDPSQPKWMRERMVREELEKRGARGITRNDRPPPAKALPQQESEMQGTPITDEALMLEMGGGPPPPRRKQERPATASSGISERERVQRQRMHDMEEAIRRKEQEMRERERPSSSIPNSSTRKAKLAAEVEPVYISRNRRRPPPSASSSTSKPSTPEPDLFNAAAAAGGPSLNPFARDIATERRSQPITPIATPPPRRRPTPPRSAPPQRSIPPISPSSLSQSNTARRAGTDAFKLGDYTAAQAHYTTSLNPIPPTHPLRIILLLNRAISTLKLGDPKTALQDLDTILQLVGVSHGDGETVSLDGTDKDMKEYWTKAVSRRAECLEQMEKWTDAKAAWEEALSAGAGQPAINGKRRCESALAPKPPPQQKQKPVVKAKPAPLRREKPSEAVSALRAANADAERQDNERLELHDSVHERIGAWKNGKEGNLRALLAGLDVVLWEGSGWKKVGMGELLVPQKVKIAYMKGIAKVHPDKIRQDATTEQRMISAAVFSLLNDSWEKFKAENGM